MAREEAVQAIGIDDAVDDDDEDDQGDDDDGGNDDDDEDQSLEGAERVPTAESNDFK